MPEYRHIHKDKLEIDPENARPEPKIDMKLRKSIKKKGILQPLVVRPSDDKFLITVGGMRFENGKNVGLDEFPCLIVEELEDDDIEAMSTSVHENLYRVDLSPGDWAEIVKDFCLKIGGDPSDAVAEVSERTGMSEKQVERHLKNADMPDWYLELMKNPKDRDLPKWVKATAREPENRTDSQRESLEEVLPNDVESEEVDKVLSGGPLDSLQLSDAHIAETLAESDDYEEMVKENPVEALRTAIEASETGRGNVESVVEKGKKRMRNEEKEGSGRRSKKRGHKVEFKLRDKYYGMLEDYADFEGAASPNIIAKREVLKALEEDVKGNPRITKIK